MSDVFSGTNQDIFVSTGAAKIIQLRSDVDFMNVYNLTIAGANQTVAVGVQYYWQRGMANGGMLAYYKSNAANATNLIQYLTTGGFTLINNTINTPGPLISLSAISSANPPVVTTASTASLSTGDIVRIFNTTGGQQLGGLDFTIEVLNGTTFSLVYGPTIVAATTGSFRKIPYNPYFYPPTRVISSISQATQAVVELTVTHAFTVGQRIRFVIPEVTAAAYGMTQLNDVEATIVAVNLTTNTITVDVDTTAMTAFAWPLTADPTHTPAHVVPVGEDTAEAISQGVNVLGDAEVNQGFIGISLAGGAGSPGGAAGDLMMWVAGKSRTGGA